MLDENLPTFYIKPSSSDNPLSSTIYLTQNASELHPEYNLRRPDPTLPASKNCYALALYDSYSPEVLYAEVLVQPDWAPPTLSQAEIRAQNGVPPPPVPIVPNSFVIQLYNPDQQIKVRQVPGTWNSSAYWEFEMPQNSFRLPSVSALDRTSDDPAASAVTPKIPFKWRKERSKDISCYLSGNTNNGRKNKEPDIIVAMHKCGKDQSSLTIYEPNMHRVDVEDFKGLEVVFLLGAQVIKDIFFNANREMFNIGSTAGNTKPKRKTSGPVLGGRKLSGSSPPMMSGAFSPSPPRQNIPPSQVPPQQSPRTQQHGARPPPANAHTQWEIDAETARLKAMVEAEEKEREKEERKEQKRIKKMLEEEEKEQIRREAEVAKETERLRKQYGVPTMIPPPPQRTQFQPTLPPRQHSNSLGHGDYPQQLSQYQTGPHSPPPPVQRPFSTSSAAHPPKPPQSFIANLLGGSGSQQQPGPYLQASGNQAATSSGFFGSLTGNGKKVQKKKSVFF